jgi:hypothetical protein
MTTDTPRARLERAFEALKKQNITPLLMLAGSTGIIEDNMADYRDLAQAAGTPGSWVGAHVGAREHRGAYWGDRGDQLLFRYDDSPVMEVWFSFPLGREDIAQALLAALEAQAFYASWFLYDGDGQIIGPGTDVACVRLVLKED